MALCRLSPVFDRLATIRGMSKKLQFQGEKSPSIGQKVAITSWYLVCAASAAWLTFSAPMESNRPGSPGGTASEHARHIWKARPENLGHLYAEGLFSYSRHVNYSGDLLVFGGCAMLTRQPWTGIVPLAMGLNFALLIIPAHDAYLAARYGSEFDRDARRTSKLIPLLY